MSEFQFTNFPAFLGAKSRLGDDSAGRSKRAAGKVRRAAGLIETTAFDEAGEQPTAVVAQLIMLAADLERLAQTIERGGKES